jgi:hypothetical protein
VTDLFGSIETPPREFKDIRNQRESIAEEKARLCADLNTLLRRTPKASAIGTIQQVRGYRAAHKLALRILQSKTSSRQELLSAITSMQGWLG